MKSEAGAAAVNWQVKNAVELQQQERGGNFFVLGRGTCVKHLAVSAGRVLQRHFCFPSLPRMINSCLLNIAQLFSCPWQWHHGRDGALQTLDQPCDSWSRVLIQELGRALHWECAWLALLPKQERMHREVPKPSIQLVNIPAPSNRDELQLVPKGETQMSLCRSRTRVVICSCVCEYFRNA